MKFVYPAIFYPEEVGGYSVVFPDIEGCYTQGDDIRDCVINAEEALEAMLSTLLVDKVKLPNASEKVNAPAGCIVSYISIDIDISKLDKAVRKTITIPHWLNVEAENRGINFSQTLQEALIKKISMT